MLIHTLLSLFLLLFIKINEINIFRQSTLVSHNGILALSRIAINLKHINGTQEGVVQIFNQKIFSPPSTLDKLILEQLGNILVEASVTF